MVVEVCPGAGRKSGGNGSRPTEERRSLYLRDGDVIPSVITKIDDDGVWFKTSLSTSTFVAHAKVKAVELATSPRAVSDNVGLTKSKRERLLTLPRMQKADPPTHLIRSKNGDYLRGRVSKMDDKTLEVEIRLENKDLPRDRISRIIWLHADELDPSKKPAAPTGRPVDARPGRSATTASGSRSRPDQFAGTTLSGKSDVLGACQVAVSQVDQLLIGDAIDQAAAQLDLSAMEAEERARAEVRHGRRRRRRGRRRLGHRIAAGRQAGPRFHPRPRGRQAVSPGRQQGQGSGRARLLGHLVRPLPASDAAGRAGGRTSSKTRTCGSSRSTSRKRPRK